MKFLFIVQGEGRGHLTQALALEDILRRNGHEVVEVLVGKSNSRELPDFFRHKMQASIQRFTSPNFLPTPSNKRVSLPRSIAYNLIKLPSYLKSMHFLKKRIQESRVDLVINFYELLTGLTYLFLAPGIPQICIGHQYLFLHKDFVFPDKNRLSLFMLKLFTQLTCLEARECLALSFRRMEEDEIRGIRVVPPLLRKEALQSTSSKGDYIHGYMVNSGFSESIRKWHLRNPSVMLHFFWDKRGADTPLEIAPTLTFHPLDDVRFLHSMAGCRAYATTGGFESVCEAMYLGKPVLMVPAHIEQDCNAFEASRYGAGILSSEFELDKLLAFSETYHPLPEFPQWVRNAEFIFLRELEKRPTLNYPSLTESTMPGLWPA